jgi:hypothetical protein
MTELWIKSREFCKFKSPSHREQAGGSGGGGGASKEEGGRQKKKGEGRRKKRGGRSDWGERREGGTGWRLVDGRRLWAELRCKAKGISKAIKPLYSTSPR